MSYKFSLSPKARRTTRTMTMFHRKIQYALIKSGMKQQEIAKKLDIDRAVINKRLKSDANITIRSISEFAYALNMEVSFDLVKKEEKNRGNYYELDSRDPHYSKNYPQKEADQASISAYGELSFGES